MINESLYPIGWRFNSLDCVLSSQDKNNIIFLLEDESEKLWDTFFPFHILMDINNNHCSIIKKRELDFDDSEASKTFFVNHLEGINLVFFHWGRRASAIVPTNILIKAWDDFFYPDDESSIIFIPNKKNIIFSHEEIFFYAEIRVLSH